MFELGRKINGGLGKGVFWIVMTKHAGKEYEENVSNYSKYIREYIRAEEFSETEGKVILPLLMEEEKQAR